MDDLYLGQYAVEPGAEAVGEARELFRNGQLEEALDAAAHELSGAREAPALALELWYIRIQALLVLQFKTEATREIAAHLTALDAPETHRLLADDAAARFWAWKLRLLLVPVKAGRINQTAIQLYYAQAFEARQEHAWSVRDQAGSSVDDGDGAAVPAQWWLDGVEQAGLYAFSALLTLRDYGAAIELLTTQFRAAPRPEIARWLALTHTMAGDTLGARRWLPEAGDARDTLQQLVHFAEDDSRALGIGPLAGLYGPELAAAVAALAAFAPQDGTPTALAAARNAHAVEPLT